MSTGLGKGVWSVVVLVVTGALACAGDTQPRSTGPQIGLRRGGNWSLLSLKLPHLNGTHFNMNLRDGTLTGTISAGLAPGGTVHLRIEESAEEAIVDGQGPHGPVTFDVYQEGTTVVADGMWNGGRLHVLFGPESIKGTIPANARFQHNLRIEDPMGIATQRRAREPLAALVDPGPGDVSCEYQLDGLSPDRALEGGSICAGMPQETRLEIPAAAHSWLTTPELVTVLLVVLSAPPVSFSERFGPQFDVGPGLVDPMGNPTLFPDEQHQ